MNIPRVIVIFLAGVVASCSEKSGGDRSHLQTTEATPREEAGPPKEERAVDSERKDEDELSPAEDEVAEDCVAFLRSTKTVPAHSANADCPQCPATTEATEVLKFDDIHVDRVAHSESTCEVHVTIHATFNPSPSESITGGLTAWISPEQRAQYLQGKTPSDQQIYQVKITYRRDPKGWRAVEFDRP
jgi:hypothetical protein